MLFWMRVQRLWMWVGRIQMRWSWLWVRMKRVCMGEVSVWMKMVKGIMMWNIWLRVVFLKL